MPEQVTITKDQLQQALLDWEQENRAGKCDPNTAQLSTEEVAKRNADHMWTRLKAAGTS